MKQSFSLLRNIRVSIGLTQPQMASYLGVNLSQYSMAEGKLRELPSAASIQYSYLQLSMIAKPTAECKSKLSDNDKEQQAKLKKWAADELVDSKIKLYRLNQKLENYKMKAGQGVMLLQTSIHRAANPRKEDNIKRNQTVFNFFNVLANEKLQKYGMAEQEKIAFHIAILEKQIVSLEQMIKK